MNNISFKARLVIKEAVRNSDYYPRMIINRKERDVMDDFQRSTKASRRYKLVLDEIADENTAKFSLYYKNKFLVSKKSYMLYPGEVLTHKFLMQTYNNIKRKAAHNLNGLYYYDKQMKNTTTKQAHEIKRKPPIKTVQAKPQNIADNADLEKLSIERNQRYLELIMEERKKQIQELKKENP